MEAQLSSSGETRTKYSKQFAFQTNLCIMFAYLERAINPKESSRRLGDSRCKASLVRKVHSELAASVKCSKVLSIRQES